MDEVLVENFDVGVNGEDIAARDNIISSLKTIGYPEADSKSAWKDAAAEFSADGETLHILGHPVMEKWEDGYMEALAKIAMSTAKGGKVLELGFGLGISCGYIQTHKPSEHFIVEANQAVCEVARKFAISNPTPIHVLEGFWEEVVPTLPRGSFDGILFDTYPISDDEIDSIFFPFLEHAHRLLKDTGTFTYFSDEATWFSEAHLAALQSAGFSRIDGEVCAVTPPDDCKYWKQKSILAPIVRK